ncbi:MAG TPA: ATP-grasp domain-containing protein [Gemmatimonadaceae bacterium]|jgi:D-alanine-D-alanine ligase|nr:ATP-grasp domain-containing protein [Gemmatimonadaceae bacterium]
MKVVVLHTKDAVDGEEDPVLGQLEQALRNGGNEPRRVMVDAAVEPVVQELTSERPDIVINLAESFAGKSALESSVAGLLNLLDLRYTGSSPAGLMVAGDKTLSKKVLLFHGIKTPQFVTVYRGMVDWAGDVNFPLIVKPPQEDASLGITQKSIVHDVKELLERIADLQSEYQQPALAEQYVEGREFYVGVLGNANARALPVIELDFSRFPSDRPRIASWAAKWGDAGDAKGAEFEGTESVFPDDLPDEWRETMQKVAVEAFHALRLRDYARVDMRVTEAGEVYVIEVNPNCYLEAKSEFARAAERDGLSYDALIAQIIELASARYAR